MVEGSPHVWSLPYGVGNGYAPSVCIEPAVPEYGAYFPIFFGVKQVLHAKINPVRRALLAVSCGGQPSRCTPPKN